MVVNEGRRRYVYGAGFARKVTAGHLTYCMGKSVDAIVVSNGHKEMDEYSFPKCLSDEKIPILEYDEIDNDGELCDFYVTLDEGKDEVIQALQTAQNWGGVDVTTDLPVIIEKYNGVLLDKLGIKTLGDVLVFSGVKTVNYLKENKGVKKSFWETYGDELLPSVYRDNSLAVDGPYEIDDLNVSVKSGDVIFDIGANLGLFSCYASEKGCDVNAFDPDATCLSYLERQKRLYPTIRIVPIGLSNQSGKKDFYESENCALSSMSRIAEGNHRKRKLLLTHWIILFQKTT